VFTAVVRISGAGRLADFRERLRWLMVRDPDAEDYTEHHAAGSLEYRFEPRRGIPFPAFTAASAEFPELKVEAQWQHDGVQGRALIENGRLVEHSAAQAGAPEIAIELAEDARLAFAMVCAHSGDTCAGYAASADRHTYFRFAGGKLELLDPEMADGELEELAFAFIGEWIWFDESGPEESALERARYSAYGYPVRGANLRSEKLAQIRDRGGRYSSLTEAGRKASQALAGQWLSPK
jgi:hypothetical protein